MIKPSYVVFSLLFSKLLFASLPIYKYFPQEGWGKVEPTYKITRNVDANNCEFYVNSFGLGRVNYNGSGSRWFESYVSINERSLVHQEGGEILNQGVYLKAIDDERLYLADSIEPAYYKLRFEYFKKHDPNDHSNFYIEIQQIAFFVDVKRYNRDIDRIWLKNGATDYTLDDIFSKQPTKTVYHSRAETHYALEGPLFNQKKACLLFSFAFMKI